jgi:hypothetical protein
VGEHAQNEKLYIKGEEYIKNKFDSLTDLTGYGEIENRRPFMTCTSDRVPACDPVEEGNYSKLRRQIRPWASVQSNLTGTTNQKIEMERC